MSISADNNKLRVKKIRVAIYNGNGDTLIQDEEILFKTEDKLKSAIEDYMRTYNSRGWDSFEIRVYENIKKDEYSLTKKVLMYKGSYQRSHGLSLTKCGV